MSRLWVSVGCYFVYLMIQMQKSVGVVFFVPDVFYLWLGTGVLLFLWFWRSCIGRHGALWEFWEIRLGG